LTGLEGLVLRSRVPSYAIRTDFQVVNFMKNMSAISELDPILQEAQKRYLGQILLQSFRWNNMCDELESLIEEQEGKKIEGKEEAVEFLKDLLAKLRAQEVVANKFITQLYKMLAQAEIDYEKICERSNAAGSWFLPLFSKECLEPMERHIEEWKVKKRTKKYISTLKSILLDFKRKHEQLKHSQTIAEALNKSSDELTEELLQWNKPKDDLVKEVEEKEKDTKQISLDMFMDGSDIEEIAKKRDMVVGTIYGHLINFIGTDIEATDLMAEDELHKIVEIINKNPEASATEIRTLMDMKVDYPQIRIAQKFLEVK